MNSSSRETVTFLSRQPHLMFWLSIPFVLIIGYSSAPQFNLNLKDSTIVLSSKEIAYIISLIYLIYGFIYASMIRSGKRLITTFTMIHLFCSLDLAVIFWIIYLLYRTDMNGGYSLECNGLPKIILVIMASAQLVFLAHIILVSFRARK